MFYDGVILTGAARPGFSFHEDLAEFREVDNIVSFFRNLGPVRLRTHLAQFGYNIRAVDFCDFYDEPTMRTILNNVVSTKTKFLGLSTVFLKVDFWDKYTEVFLELKAKFPNLKIIVGGQHSAYVPNTKYIDFCISGYAESALLNYLQYLDGAQNSLIVKEENTIDGNVDYPFSSVAINNIWLPEDAVQPYEALPIEASRGCIFKCAFCNFPMKGKKKLDYIREEDNLESELMRNYELFGVKNYVFVDDTFNDSTTKLEKFQKMSSRLPFKMNFTSYIKPDLLVVFPEQIDLLIDIGIISANYGIESFNYKTRMAVKKMGEINKIIDAMKQMKDRSGGKVYNGINMIVGLPHESAESVQEAHDYIMKEDCIDGAFWQPLFIVNKEKTPEKKLSPIDINPESYGYKTKLLSAKTGQMFWKNEHLNYIKAIELTNKFAVDNLKNKNIHSFMIPNIMNTGFDINKYDGSMKMSDIDSDVFSFMENGINKTVEGYLQKLM
jgi:radical SAM superfamily enzyme YgiQ (UPF0313 family)